MARYFTALNRLLLQVSRTWVLLPVFSSCLSLDFISPCGFLVSPVCMKEAETKGEGDWERQIEMLCWAFCAIIVHVQCPVTMQKKHLMHMYTQRGSATELLCNGCDSNSER